ncbi:MAG: DUF2924 domain-containing protein [Betaproteobacteria bacterium]|nr:DUF2924 domain-containing protein [Betaproteobacteria bacterium]
MGTIEVDAEVYAALKARSGGENVTENDVLRELLRLPKRENSYAASAKSIAPQDWFVRGVRFPAGTEFRARYRGNIYLATVENGALVLNGERFSTPSSAAVSITTMTTNGWMFWKCRLPGQESWKSINVFRNQR